MTELDERLQRLADFGAHGVTLARPDVSPTVSPRPGRRLMVGLAAAAALAVIIPVVVLLTRDDDPVSVATGGGEAVVAVTGEMADVEARCRLTGACAGFVYVPPPAHRIRITTSTGEVVADRLWHEAVDFTVGVTQHSSLIQHVPAGELEFELWRDLDNGPADCGRSFATAAGDQLILKLPLASEGFGDGDRCVAVTRAEDWAGRSSPTGAGYVGLTEQEATDRADTAGLTSHVAASDGITLIGEEDVQPLSHLDIWMFDGKVVAARLAGEEVSPPTSEPTPTTVAPEPPPSGGGTLLVDLEPLDGILFEGFDVTLEVYGPTGELVAEREWSEAVPDTADEYDFVLEQPVPAGSVKLVSWMRISPGGAIPEPSGPGCETTVEVADDDLARITLLFQTSFEGDPDPTCAAIAAISAEADEIIDSWGGGVGKPAPGFVGLTEDKADNFARQQGWTVRVLARDGVTSGWNDDLRPDRVNLVLESGIVTAAARG